MKTLLRFIFGTLDVSVQGNVERFLTLAFQERLRLWNIRRGENATAYFRIYRVDFKCLRPLVRRSHVKVHILHKRGLPHRLRHYHARVGLLVGAVLLAAGLYVCSLFIWRIEVTGCREMTVQEVIGLLSEHGFEVGCRRRGANTAAIENACLKDSDKMSWMSINIKGTSAFVEIRERSEPPPRIDPSEPCSIYASRDGVIESVQDYMGYSLVKPGDTVTAGQLIVSGLYTDKYGIEYKLHSYAKITAFTTHSKTVRIPLKFKEHIRTGSSRRQYSLKLIKLKIPLYFSKKIMYNNYDTTVSERVLRLSDSFALPVSLIKTTVTETVERECTRSEEAALQDAYEQLRDYEYDLVGVTVLDRAYEENVDEEAVTVRVLLDCCEEIGITRKIN